MLNGKLKITIQKKGKLSDRSNQLLNDIGLDYQKFDRQLYANCENFDASILFSRDDDIPEYVESGAVDIGIVGIDQVLESKVDVEILKQLDFGKCKLCIAVKYDSNISSIDDLNNKVISTSFPNIVKRYFKEKNVKAKIVQIEGGVEITPALGISDAIVDLVSSGFTLKVNSLKIIDDIQEIYPVIISNKNLTNEKRLKVEEILFRINAVVKSKSQNYLMFNLPENKLNEIKEIAPGLKSPTVSNLAIEGWISVQTVINESRFWEIISRIKDIGAEGIIVLPIEKLIY